MLSRLAAADRRRVCRAARRERSWQRVQGTLARQTRRALGQWTKGVRLRRCNGFGSISARPARPSAGSVLSQTRALGRKPLSLSLSLRPCAEPAEYVVDVRSRSRRNSVLPRRLWFFRRAIRAARFSPTRLRHRPRWSALVCRLGTRWVLLDLAWCATDTLVHRRRVVTTRQSITRCGGGRYCGLVAHSSSPSCRGSAH